MPETYCINDLNWSAVLSNIAVKYYMKNNQLLDQVGNLLWILKPSLLNNGQHIKIFRELSQIEQHYISSNRMGGEHVLQRYITQPHLLNGKKYSIRMFVILTNYSGAYLYPYGYFNIAVHPYNPNDLFDLNSHLTNEHLREHETNVVQIPTVQFPFFPPIYLKIINIIKDTINGLQKLHPSAFICKNQRTLALFGFDFIVDANMNVWLLEANHVPCFPNSDDHPLHTSLYHGFWQAFIDNFIVPIAAREPVKHIKYQSFTPIAT
jgi:tubulin--tyrosine ligase